jgi:hypothetical protein
MATADTHRDSLAGHTDPVRWAFDRLRIDHTHNRYHHRIARALADRLPTVLEHEEKVLWFTEAIEDSDFLTRAALGFGWPLWRRVALLFTDRRLVEVGLSSFARRARGRVRSFPWDRIPGFDAKARKLEVATWRETSHRWRLRERLDAGLEAALRQQVDLAVSTYQPSQGLSVPIRLCDDCGAPVRTPRASCGRCGRRVRSSRLAGVLAMAFPGAGHGYTGHWAAATLRLGAELAGFGWLVSRILAARSPAEVVTPVVAGVVLICIIKMQGTAVARRLAARAELVKPPAERRWRWFAGLTAALSVAALLLPLGLAGQIDSDISWDLDFIVNDGEWSGHRAAPPADRAPPDGALRSQWVQRAGLRADVRAWPMRPFESVAAAWERCVADAGGDADTLVLGPHRVLASRIDDEKGHTTLRYAIIDGEGRDIHVVSTDVPAEHIDRSARELEGLISHGIWVPASSPQVGRS